MSRDSTLGLFLIALLFGSVLLLARRPANPTSLQPYSGNIKTIPIAAEPRRYQNKETRNIEYNEDGLPTKIEIIRDYTIT